VKLTNRISNLKFKDKILIMMIPLLALLCLVICVANMAYFTYLYKADARNSAESWLSVSTSSFNQRWKEVLDGILDISGSKELQTIVSDIVADKEDFLRIQSRLQPPIDRMTGASPLIDSTYFITSDGTVYSAYTDRIADEQSSLLAYSRFEDLQRITFLGATQSPFSPKKTVIPIVVPLSMLGMSQYLVLANGNIDIVLVCLLDSAALYAELNKGRSSYFDSSCFLFDSEGTAILFPADVSLLENDEYTILTSPTSVDGLNTALAISISSYLPKKLVLIFFCLLVALVAITIGVAAIMSISSFLTRPFNTLMRMVDEIRRNCYRQDVVPRFNDETGALIQAINSMYVTIQDQIALIRTSEKQKYQYMEQVLTEQINPHFIYNTLETINMEILGGHADTAAALVRTFATFLRCNLNNGKDLTTIDGELKQAAAYMEIMNQRLNNKILFTCRADEQLKQFVIPKSILQPMIENAIKHGLNNGIRADGLLLPAITIDIRREDDSVSIEVTDNGKGIDIERAREASLAPEGDRHIGLRNIRQRLELYFGSVEMEFSGIPYFQNTVGIKIPYLTLEQDTL
jgi:two-component system sensor histidine kinase YesM